MIIGIGKFKCGGDWAIYSPTPSIVILYSCSHPLNKNDFDLIKNKYDTLYMFEQNNGNLLLNRSKKFDLLISIDEFKDFLTCRTSYECHIWLEESISVKSFFRSEVEAFELKL